VLAGHQEDQRFAAVADLERRHAAALAQLGHLEQALGETVVQGQVINPRPGAPAQAEDLEPFAPDRGIHLDHLETFCQ
jgi:hypothetical protein